MANQSLPTLTVNAGYHNRDECPVSVSVDHPGVSQLHDHAVILTDTTSGNVISAQCYANEDGITTLNWILDGLAAGESRTYTLSEGSVAGESGVQLKEETGTIAVTLNDRPFTTFRYAKSQFRPYFFPVLGPNGREVTRGETSDISNHLRNIPTLMTEAHKIQNKMMENMLERKTIPYNLRNL